MWNFQLNAALLRRGRLLLGVCLVFAFSLSLLTWYTVPRRPFHIGSAQLNRPKLAQRPISDAPTAADLPIVPCRGPRGGLLNEPGSLDVPQHELELPNITFPETTTGSYDSLGLEQSWMTFEQRYGPYGYGEKDKDYNFTVLNWEQDVNWGKLSDACFRANQDRFHGNESLQVGAKPRFRFPGDDADTALPPRNKTGRQAIVLRSWSTFIYTPEDFYNIRSIINEAALTTGGEYAVILLVDVKREDGARIHTDDKFYQHVLAESVPPEFRDIAVLFHRSLVEKWYSKVGEHKTLWQVMQPFQIFAHFYPEFDHFWQLEMDTRFTGDAGAMLRAWHAFGTREPYKQARERASWTHIPRIHGTYEEHSHKINDSMEGGATIWGPIRIPNIEPIGPAPPFEDPHKDNFTFGRGWEADLLLLNRMNDVNRFERGNDWVFRDWYSDAFPRNVPRHMSVPAQSRASWELLEAIHLSQHEDGLRVPSEATLPSWALWHGLKVVALPIPRFQDPERDIDELNLVMNGGRIADFKDGISNGASPYRATAVSFFTNRMTWDWATAVADPIFLGWQKIEGFTAPESFMKEVAGRVYCPPFIMHPRKTGEGP